MKFRQFALAGALSLLAAAEAFAVPVTVNPGESVFFNFDLTGATPGPVYDEIRITTNLTDFDGDELGVWNFYDEFGPPPGTFIGGGGTLNTPEFVITLPGVLDGVFSLQIVLLAGSGSGVTVDPFVVGVDANGVTTGEIPPVGVAEPATLALFAAGLAGLAIRRRKQAA